MAEHVDNTNETNDLISRQMAIGIIMIHKNVISQFSKDGMYADGYFLAHDHICDMIKTLPCVQSECKKGHWIYYPERQVDGECPYECSECGMGSDVDYDYCMKCGTKMKYSNDE